VHCAHGLLLAARLWRPE